MYGAFIGDIVGSKYEFNNIKTKDFPLFSPGCDYTDDSIMTAAVAQAILCTAREDCGDFSRVLVETMQDFGRRYPHPTGAYGGRFADWLRRENPAPYGSYGNGSAMRVSPCALAAVTLEEALELARVSAAVTHNHPEGIKGAQAVAAALFLAKTGASKEEIRQYVAEHFYSLDFTLDSIRADYHFDVSCQGSVPQAIVAFLESADFEDAVQGAVSIGGDCDTTGAMAGSIAWTYYTVEAGGTEAWVQGRIPPAMEEIRAQADSLLPQEFIDIASAFHQLCRRRWEDWQSSGACAPILSPCP